MQVYLNQFYNDLSLLSQAVTLVESNLYEHRTLAQEVIEKCLPHTCKSVRIGITGVPGAGKSTSIDAFGMTKADENIYKEAARRIGVTPQECIMADDNLNVLKTAKRVGMGTVGVYDDSSKDVVEEMRQVADKYVVDFSELL